MKNAIRNYERATIYFKEGGFSEAYDVELLSNMVIYLDPEGNERTLPMFFVKEIVSYYQDRYEKTS